MISENITARSTLKRAFDFLYIHLVSSPAKMICKPTKGCRLIKDVRGKRKWIIFSHCRVLFYYFYLNVCFEGDLRDLINIIEQWQMISMSSSQYYYKLVMFSLNFAKNNQCVIAGKFVWQTFSFRGNDGVEHFYFCRWRRIHWTEWSKTLLSISFY